MSFECSFVLKMLHEGCLLKRCAVLLQEEQQAAESSPGEARAKAMSLLDQLEGSYSIIAGHGSTGAARCLQQPVHQLPSPAAACADIANGHVAMPGRGSTRAAGPGAPNLEPAEASTWNADDAPVSTAAQDYSDQEADKERRGSHALASARQDDIAALGALIVQLYSRRVHHVRLRDMPYWQRQAKNISSAARVLVLSCLSSNPSSRPDIEKVLRDAFFGPAVRIASAFLESVRPAEALQQPGRPPMLEQRAEGMDPGSDSSNNDVARKQLRYWRSAYDALGQIDKSAWMQQLSKAPGALEMCLPIILQLLAAAAVRDAADAAGAQTSQHILASTGHAASSRGDVSAYKSVMWQVLDQAPRQQLQTSILPLWRQVLQGSAADLLASQCSSRAAVDVDPAVQALLMQLELLRKLLDRVPLSDFLSSVHACILDVVCSSSLRPERSTSLVQTATQVDIPLLNLFAGT